ncbi:EAL domain-containing protein [Microvirga guangxiensis]|uniref:Cyclic-di-GMP phosphodiesterase, flagellum assembly factor TipF n=1 Tax=Microvirga guangxiensis TaxID=549386 RepID=A0A1G5JHQ5_9HYPH|nr:EAL domain-containing protein [Microvirga guangxiensis]SCY87441.1 cyclic-di-GMP phosphodiesterase, flagellum assembly factor TipF [Microvirga guangxiensis]
MVTDRVHIDKELRAKLFALALASLAMTGAAVGFLPADAVMPLVIFLGIAASAGLVLAWRKADEASSNAQLAMDELVAVNERLVALEQLLQANPTTTPALRTTMAEVTGTVGLLGGVVRELAKNVATQNRDVAELKGRLKSDDALPEKVAPVMLPQTAVSASRPAPQPAPRKAEEEIRRMRLIMQAFESDSIELHLQPIVSLPQRKIRFYEALARLRLADGTLLGPSEFLGALERLGRAPEFDRRVLNRAMAVAYHLITKGSEAIVGVNLTPHSVREPGFLWSLTGLVDAAPETLGKVVLEFPQECWRELDADGKEALSVLRDKGVPLSLDTAIDLRFDARELANLGVRFVKLPAELLVAAEQDEHHHLSPELGVRDFASALRREGIRLVAEHVEREETVPVLSEIGVPLAQGFVFAAPRAVKAEVLGTAPPQAPSKNAQPLLRRAG